ncbi:DUF1599 domain-containing protein [Blattabacterium cuenoti]|uniref:Nucleotide modification associated domain-containing protein n=1 Tax=Blattabacterium cuenoti STAT TaxID=1457030 RepID=A0A224AKB2_9FLAO|nr:DUF1599 domain-containing protein [Blattabacterium cuenoti]BBA17070.1 hypothetical protein STAT_132 [Blattabacterium cuenoti STAT]
MNIKNNIDTSIQYDAILRKCRTFLKKKLIENLQKKDINNILFLKIKNNKWIDVINLSIIAIIFYKKNIINMEIFFLRKNNIDIHNYYDIYTKKAKLLMIKKNFDYKEAWKIMDFSSIKDIIFQKLFRIQNMEKNLQDINNSYEKIYDNYIDILNYSIFMLIKIEK